jgi:hypothetical protein
VHDRGRRRRAHQASLHELPAADSSLHGSHLARSGARYARPRREVKPANGSFPR